MMKLYLIILTMGRYNSLISIYLKIGGKRYNADNGNRDDDADDEISPIVSINI